MNRKHCNDVHNSIIVTLIQALGIAFYSFCLYGTITSNNLNATAVVIILFVIHVVSLTILLMCKCYEYWSVDNEKIIYKSPIHTKKVIYFEQVIKIEIRVVNSLLNNACKAYVITSPTTQITIFVTKESQRVFDRLYRNNILPRAF